MVAPLVLNRPTRVFARLTHTGENKAAEPVCCDLSRVASILPANPLPKNLTSTHVDHSAASATALPASRKLVHPSLEDNREKCAAGKRKREEGGDEVRAATVPTVTQITSSVQDGYQESAAKKLKLDLKPVGQTNFSREASKLSVQKEQLKIQNEELNKLVIIQMILRKEGNYNLLVKTVKKYRSDRP